jgi:hypothetical protein
MRLSTQRKQEIVRCYIVATGGRLPRDLGKLLEAMRALIPDLSEDELRKAVAWALRRPSPRPRH